MYYVNKVVGWVLSPLGAMFIGLAVAWALHYYGRRAASRNAGSALAAGMRRAAAWTLGLTVAFLWIMSCGVTTRFVGVGLEREWERSGAMHGSIEGLPAVDAIVVLGGGIAAHEECHAPELSFGSDRVWQGARLYHAMKGVNPDVCVICTGGGCEYATIPFLVDLGVDRDAIWFSEEPRNTEEESRLVKARLGEDKTHICLVTSAWHMSRAKMLFERAGFQVVPAPTDFEMSCSAEAPVAVRDFFPTADALLRNTYSVKEWVGRFCYWAFK